MAVYGVTSVRLDDVGRIAMATLRLINTQTNQWLGEPMALDAHELASLVHKGDRLVGIFLVGGHTVHGPEFRYAEYGGGHEGIELAENVPGRTLGDLIQHR